MIDAVPSLWQRLYYTPFRDLVRGRFDASLDWRSVVAEANLPEDIGNCIEQVIRKTRLWRSEKLAVASELVAHFQDGLDAGRSSEELIKQFGDPQQTAQLIRQAKKRGRSIVWQLWRYACWTLGVAAVAYLAVGLVMMMDRPSIKADYLAIMNERAASVPEEQRAWPLYRDALLAMKVKPANFDLGNPLAAASMSKPGDADWPKTEKFLTDHADALAKLRQAAGRSELGFVTATSHAAFAEKDRALFGVTVTPEDIEASKHQTVQDRWAISTLLPYLNLLRPAASLLASDTRRVALAGDGETALNDITAIYGISHHCEEIPTMVSELVAEVVQRRAREAIRDVLQDHPELWTNAQLRDLAHLVAARQIDWRRGFIGERVCFYDSIQRIYTDDGDGDGRLALNVAKDQNLFELLNSVTAQVGDPPASTPLSNGGLAMLAIPATNIAVASRKEMTEVYEGFTASALERLETPLWQKGEFPSIDEELRALQSGPFGKVRYLFVNLLLPAYDVVRNRYATSQGEREGVLVGLALELYHREHGKWPATLAELSPRWLPELPVDRLTGKPLKYKIVDDRPIVYSVGNDLDDDGAPAPISDIEPDAYPLASPVNKQSSDKDQHNGDWIIWSTAKRPAAES